MSVSENVHGVYKNEVCALQLPHEKKSVLVWCIFGKFFINVVYNSIQQKKKQRQSFADDVRVLVRELEKYRARTSRKISRITDWFGVHMTKYLKRVGATQVKFQMAVVLDRLELTIPVEGQMEVRWTRGPKTATSIAATGENGRFIWDLDGQKRSPLLQLVTMYMDKSQKFLPKKSKLVVKRKKPRGDGFKTVGYVDFDLSLYTDKDTPKETSVNFKLQNCGDKGALLYFTVHSRQQDQRIVGQQAEDEHSMAEGLEGEVDDDSVVDFTNPEQLYFAVPTTRPKPPSPTRPPKPQAPLPPPPHASPFPALNSSSREQDKHEAVEGPPEKRGEQDGGVVVVAKKSGEHDCVVVANFALLPASAALVEDARYGKPCCFSIQRDLSAKENQEDIEEDVCVFMTTSSSRRKDWLDCLARRGDMADWLIHRETVVEDVQKTGTSHVGEEKSVAVSHRWRRLWAVLSHGSSLSLHLRESSSPHLSPQISPSKTPHSTDQAIQTTTPSRKKKGLAAPPATTPSPSQQIHLQTGERGMGGAHQTDKGKGQDSGQREEDAPAQFHLAPAMSPKAGPGLNGIRSDKNGIRTVSGQKRGSTGMVNGSGSKLGKANTSQAAMGTAALQTGNLVQHAGEGEEEEEADEKAPVVFRPSPIADRGAPSKENEQADKATLVHKTGPTQTSSVQRTTVHTKHKLGELGQSVFGSSASAIVDKEGRKETRRKELGFAEFFGRGKGQGDAGGKKDNDLSAAHFEKVDTEERKGVVAMGGNVGKASKGGREDTADLLALAELADLAERAGREMRKEEEREAGVVHKGCGANGSELAGVKAFKSAVTMQLDKKAEPAAQRAGTSSLAEEIALERQRRQAAEEELEQFKKLCLQAVEELEQQNKHKETEVTTWKHRHDLVLLQVMQTKEQMNDLASSSARDRK
eukprot:g67997.t1